ncbi:MAG: DUF2589 domain-containing protein [Paludibacteraceae bacterium]|nr:DUF2589 domain-containing protein [Paludibacteraceae bacterium]
MADDNIIEGQIDENGKCVCPSEEPEKKEPEKKEPEKKEPEKKEPEKKEPEIKEPEKKEPEKKEPEDTLAERLEAGGKMVKDCGEGVKDILDGAANLAEKVNAKVELGDVTASVTEAKNAISTIENISFSKVIGEPLKAAIQAQSEAAKSTLNFIKEVGVKSGKEGDTMTVVTFNFIKNGRIAKMQIPLMTLVPIPTMRIDKMTYKFKVAISTSSSVNLVQSNTSSFTSGATAGVNYGTMTQPTQTQQPSGDKQTGDKPAGDKPTGDNQDKSKTAEKQTAAKQTAVSTPKDGVSVQTTFNVNFSSKKESKATQDSKYSVETGMDISIDVVPDDMPAGISKMLEILNDSVDIYNPAGEMSVSSNSVTLNNGMALVTASYRDGDGNYNVKAIHCTPDKDVQMLANGDSLQIIFSKPGLYTLSAGTSKFAVIVNGNAKQEEPTKSE